MQCLIEKIITFVAVKLRQNRSDEFFAPRKMAFNGIRAYALNNI